MEAELPENLNEASRVRKNAARRKVRANRKKLGIRPEKPVTDDPRPIAAGTKKAPDETRRALVGKRFVFTAAQNNTYLHEEFWKSLTRYCDVTEASLYVSRFTYNKGGWKAHGGVEKDTTDDSTDIWYDPRIVPFLLDEQVKVAKGLIFCGELDILPTAVTPLSTLGNYTGPNSGIIPHAKVQMQSLATMMEHDAKFLYTTGACTLRNYINRKAGQVATFHHCFGALLVEVSTDGQWFARQLMADDNGIFYDIDTAYGPEWDAPASTFGDTIVTLGDIHVEKLDDQAFVGALDLLTTLQPKHVFLHDLIDFEPRNHHNLDDPWFMAEQYFQGINSVRSGMEVGARLLASLVDTFKNTTFHGVRSNHDEAFVRWLKDKNGSLDPVNAGFWHERNAEVYKVIRNWQRAADLDIYAETMYLLGAPRSVHFIKADESVVINDIEYGMHGHLGPSGSRGNPKAFRQLGRKANTGHTHSAGIIDGLWTAGVLARLNMGYNRGPSSWSHSNIITYPNGKRCMITQRGSRWRADNASN